GVHIGKEDMPPATARDLLGNEYIIGATANTLEDLIRLSKEPIDYIGLGPYRFTTTKKKLSPILGLEGYRSIFSTLAEENNLPPIVAIGGIVDDDIPLLGTTGLHGVALSAVISAAADVTEKARLLRQLCNQHFQNINAHSPASGG
ncbi:MAG: thiamine phosphate synthase, partial [Bacteroidetes bacterium]|nr:thiamine phosphate synthase [Bacteroidota bacterium]